jgi:hypothetical protein
MFFQFNSPRLVEKEQARIDLWRTLAPSDVIPLTTPHPLPCSLNHIKGLRAASRGLTLLDTVQCMGFFSIIFNRLECINVCNYTLGKETEKVRFLFKILGRRISKLHATHSYPNHKRSCNEHLNSTYANYFRAA